MKKIPLFKKIFNFIIKSLISFPSEGRALSDSLKLFGWISSNGFLYICFVSSCHHQEMSSSLNLETQKQLSDMLRVGEWLYNSSDHNSLEEKTMT